jgi:hypothetical protein
MTAAGGVVANGGGAAALAGNGNEVPDTDFPCTYGKAIIALLISE